MGAINETAVREVGGVMATKTDGEHWVRVYELDRAITLRVQDKAAHLSVDDARKLSRHLNRLARRIELRQQIEEPK